MNPAFQWDWAVSFYLAEEASQAITNSRLQALESTKVTRSCH